MKPAVDLAVLDWGIGGLSVCNALDPSLGERSMLYFSDSGATPYGKLGPTQLRQRVLAVILALAERYGVRHFVVACNAASTVLPRLENVFAKRGLFVTGVIERGVELVAATDFRRVGVIGGRRTILSRIFPTRLQSARRTVVGRIAQPLSAMIERGELDSERLHATLAAILKPLRTCDALLLACTHYPAIATQIRQHLPEKCHLLDPAGATAGYVIRHWLHHGKNEAHSPHEAARIFLTSGSPDEMARASRAAFGNQLTGIDTMEIAARAREPVATVKFSSPGRSDFASAANDESLPAGFAPLSMTESPSPTDLDRPENFINRELSWLEFNHRVLEEALDPNQPLLERVRFLSIFGTNLDEFFEIRISGLKQQIENKTGFVGADHLPAAEIIAAASKRARELIALQYKCWNDDLLPALAKENIFVHAVADLPPAARAWTDSLFSEELFPVLTPLAVDPSHPFPQLANKSHNLIVRLKRPGESDISTAIVQIPRVLDRMLLVPEKSAADLGPGNHYFFLQDLIKQYLDRLFPGLEVLDADAFRMTRNSDLYIDEEEAENLLQTIEEELRRQSRGNAVRLEVQADMPPEVARFLLETFKLTEDDLYRLDGPINFLHLQPLYTSDAFPRLRDRPFQPATPKALPASADIFEVIRRQDVLLHHPYESFQSVVDLLERAVNDPQVLAIKMTLYRTSAKSSIVLALLRAAAKGKQVTVLVELKARFDELNNIRWARQMEDAGVHVVYGLVGLKTHCKMMMIVRRDDDRIRLYTHLGTGNYNATTARFYTDLSLLTTSPALTSEVAVVFNNLTGLSEYVGGKKLLVAPFELRKRFLELIANERDFARAGQEGRIIVKLNSLVDEEIIVALYEAAAAGVKIDLIVRGMCCLRPGLPGVSENIRVLSIVGRFLEHSRIYYFGNGGKGLVYLGSADWMQRNFDRRVEVVFPVEDEALKARVTDEILPAFLSDNVKARVLRSDGTYERRHPGEGEKTRQAQLTFRQLARKAQIAVVAPVAPPSANV